uniref:Uncharacterized protein n=1 Tax=Culex tarsalis TaxID=7177 RepID=A0A1Q3EZD5_CULTA
MAKDDADRPPPKKRKYPAPLSYDNRVRLAKELLRNHPVIWDRKHPKFHNNTDRDAAWTEVASTLGFDPEATRKEWKRFMNMHFTWQKRVTRRGTPAKTTQLHQLLDGLFSKDDSSESDLEEVLESGLQCKLCLRWTTNEALFDMFEDIDPVIAKIRTVLGVFLCEKPAGRKICALCRQLVELVDDYRTLCALTNELERVRLRVVDSADAVGWRSGGKRVAKVCDSVRLQQRLVERAMKEQNFKGEVEQPKGIKREVEEADGNGKEVEEDRLKLSPVEIKKEEETSSSDSEGSSDEDDSSESLYEVYKVVECEGEEEPAKIKSEPEDDYEDPIVLPEESPQNDEPEPETKPVEKQRPTTPPSDHKFTTEERLRFAQACLEHPILWDRSLHENHVNSKIRERNAAWDAIGARFDITREVARLEYKRLRNIHQSRGSRLASGELRPDDYLIVDPLFPVLCKLMGTPTKAPAGKAKAATKKTAQPKRRQQRVRPNGERRERHRMDYEWSLRFAKEIDKLEPFWNVDHADHTRPTMTKLLASLAATMQCDVATVRREWKRFGEMHRRKLMGQAHGRQPRPLKTNSKEPCSVDPLQTLLDKFFAYKTLESTSDGDGRLGVKPRFDDAGCIAQERRGVFRYVKICEECGKHVERSLFEAHMNRHRGVKPYECRFEGCKGQYTTRVNRDRHENIYHTREGFNIECDACGEKFKHKSSFEFHYAVRHKSQNLPCGICQKVFKHDRHLDFHMQKQHSVKLSNYRKSLAAKQG